METNKLPRNIILASILLIALSISYYYLIFLPQKENTRIKTNCIDKVLKEMKDAHPKMQTDEITNFRIANDRGCFIEAGCMQGVQDANFKPKFSECNNDYYNSCLSNIKNQAEEMIQAEKSKRINECIDLYSN